MKHHQVLDPCPSCEPHHVLHAAVTPAKMRRILPPRILRIHDQYVQAPDKNLELEIGKSNPSVPLELGRQLVVGEVAHAASAGDQSETNAVTWMVDPDGVNPQLTHASSVVTQILDDDRAGQIAKADGKERAFHLAGEQLGQAVPGALRAIDLDPIVGLVGRLEEGESLNVIPVGVGEEQRELKGPRLELTSKS